jgi:hypothetical protein
MMIDLELAGATAGGSGTSGAMTMREQPARRAATDAAPATSPDTKRAQPPGPIGVRLYWAICWCIYGGSALQFLLSQ